MDEQNVTCEQDITCKYNYYSIKCDCCRNTRTISTDLEIDYEHSLKYFLEHGWKKKCTIIFCPKCSNKKSSIIIVMLTRLIKLLWGYVSVFFESFILFYFLIDQCVSDGRIQGIVTRADLIDHTFFMANVLTGTFFFLKFILYFFKRL